MPARPRLFLVSGMCTVSHISAWRASKKECYPYTYMLTRYEQGSLTWIDLVTPNDVEVRAVMHEFGLHPLIAEQLLTPTDKSKVERYENAFFVVLAFPTLHRGLGMRPEQEIDFCVGKNFFITARYENVNPLHSFARAFEVRSVLGRGAPQQSQSMHLFASMLQTLYQGLQSECDALHMRLGEIEERIFKGDERRMVAELSQVGRSIHDFRQALSPHRDILHSLELPGEKLFGREFVYYMQGALHDYRKVEDELVNLREALDELRETNNSLLSTKQNEIMKTFTVMTFLFLPLTFVASIFGMNTMNNPIVGNSFDFWIIVAGMAVLALLTYVYFKRKDWL